MSVGIYSWHTFGPLSTNWALLNATGLPEYCCWPCPSLYDYKFTPLLMATSSRIMHHVHKAQIISDWFSEHDNEFTLLKWFPQSTRSQSNRAALGCGGTGDSHHGCAADKSAATAWCYHVNIDQNLWESFQNLLNLCHEELRQFWRQNWVQPVLARCA